jgi:hypothetical protein
VPRLLADSHELQRLADELEAGRLQARLREASAKRSHQERVFDLVLEGWSLTTARAYVHGRDGMVTAYHDSQSPIELGINPKKMTDRKSGRKRRGRKSARYVVPWYLC